MAGDLQDKIAEAFPAIFAEEGLVTKWVCLVEFLDPKDGERGIWCVTSEGLKAYETLGLLEYARLVEQARIMGIHQEEGDS